MTRSENRENHEIQELFGKLCSQPKRLFPQQRKPLDAPSKHGVYIFRKEKTVLHVGRTLRGRNGISQRLRDHLQGASSFTKKYLNGKGKTLRKGKHTYQYLEVKDPRKRAFLEAYATGMLCPKHIGLGE